MHDPDDFYSPPPSYETSERRGGGTAMKQPGPDPNARFDYPFSPLSGIFSDNTRDLSRDNLDELRASMKALGWLKEFPAFQDERGVVLVGHRRIKVARELGIDPIVVTLQFGQGDAADARRLALAPLLTML